MDYRPLQGRSWGSPSTLSSTLKDEHNTYSSMKVLEERLKKGRVVSIKYSNDANQSLLVSWNNEMESMNVYDAKETIFRSNTPHSYNSAEFRSDGSLIVYTVGDKGKFEVIDTRGKVLRAFRCHNGSATGATFTSSRVQIASWGVDRKVCLSSLATEQTIHDFNDAHDDTIFSGCASMEHDDMLATGCGSGFIKLWDLREKNAVLSCKAGVDTTNCALYKIKFVPNMSYFHIACGTSSGHLQLFDIRNLGSGASADTSNHPSTFCMRTSQPHAKALSDFCFAKNGSRIISGGLDGRVVVHCTDNLQPIFVSHESLLGISSLGCVEDGSEISIGHENGKLTRKIIQNLHSSQVNLDDGKLQSHWSKPLGPRLRHARSEQTKADAYLRAFSYRKALIAALDDFEKKRDNADELLYAIIEELLRRKALRIALSAWNEKYLIRFFIYLTTHMRHRGRCLLMVTTIEVICEIYSEEIVKSSKISMIIQSIEKDSELMLDNVQSCGKLTAMLDSFF